jgi:hypothetical protein
MDTTQLEESIALLVRLGSEKKKRTVFTISNTSKVAGVGSYLTPIREFYNLIVSGIVVYSPEIAKNAAALADGRVNYVFVDAEKKIPKDPKSGEDINIELDVKRIVANSCCISYKANDMSVDAADSFISEIYRKDILGVGRKKIALIGLGNIGFKLALKLVERGASVHCYRRDRDVLLRMVDTINLVKSKYTLASAIAADSVRGACQSADIILGVTNGIGAISESDLDGLSQDAFVMDIGKGSFSAEASAFLLRKKIPEYRLSIEHVFEGFLEAHIALESRYMAKVGRDFVEGISVVSGGLTAYEGEAVVDDFRDPKVVYGIANGRGDFQKANRERIKDLQLKLGII